MHSKIMKRGIVAALTAALLLIAGQAEAQKLEYDDVLQGERFIGTTYRNVFPKGNDIGWMSLSARVDAEGTTHYYVELMLQAENTPRTMAKGSAMEMRMKDGTSVLLQTGDEGQESHREHLINVEDQTTWHPVVGLIYDPWRYRPFLGHYAPVPLDAQRTYYHHELAVTDRLSVYFEVTPQTVQQIIQGKVQRVSIRTNEDMVVKNVKWNRVSKCIRKDWKIIQKRLSL